MNVYILRHGKAEDQGAKPDNERELTQEGIDSLKDSMPGMKKLIGQVDFILTSPYWRAARTAQIVGEYFRCSSFIDGTDLLAQPDQEDGVIKHINRLIGKENVVVVGHQPYLGELIRLMAPEGSLPEGEIEIKKGGLAKVVFKGFVLPHKGRLEWIKTPKELKKD